MSWAARRRFIILLIIGAIVALFFAALSVSVFRTTPSCSDGIQNQSEAGVDCGGPCQRLCTALEESPTVLFTQVLPSAAGYSAVIASVENKNTQAAAKAVPYVVTLYGADQVLIQTINGMLDLPPSTSVPVFVPNISTGNQVVTSAFLTIDPTAVLWYRDTSKHSVPTIVDTKLGGGTTTPRVKATLANANVTALSDIPVVVLVHGENDNIIAASATVIPLIPGEGQADAIVTWNEAFSAPPLSIEVVPITVLP